MTPEHLAAIRRRSTAAVQAYRFGTTGTTPMDVDGLTINEALDIVAESAKDVPALLAEVGQGLVGVAVADRLEPLARIWQEQREIELSAPMTQQVRSLRDLLNPEETP